MLSTLRRLLRPSSPDGPTPRPLVEIGWMDAAHKPNDDDVEPANLGGLIPLISAGFLIRVTPELIVLASDHSPEDFSMRNSTTIPLGWAVFARVPGHGIVRGPRLLKYHEEFKDAEVTAEATTHRRSNRRAPREGAVAEGSA